MQLRSPMQIVMAMDVDQRTELQSMIYDLEEENRWVLLVFKMCEKLEFLIYEIFCCIQFDVLKHSNNNTSNIHVFDVLLLL